MVAKSLPEKLTWFQVNVSVLNEDSELERISPILKEPKKARQQAAQKTFLLSVFQLLVAISCPINFKRGRVMTSFACLEMFEYRDIFSAPFSMDFVKKSEKIFGSRSLRLWAIFRSEMYSLTVLGHNFFTVKDQFTYFLKFCMEMGQVTGMFSEWQNL